MCESIPAKASSGTLTKEKMHPPFSSRSCSPSSQRREKMEKLRFSLLLLLACFLLSESKSDSIQASSSEKKTYIVHASKSSMPPSFTTHQLWYDSSLKSVSSSADIIYTYDTILHGFSARLTDSEAQALETQQGILAVLPELRYELHTTRTPEFLGIANSAAFQPESDSDSDIVVGVLDTGVWPESKSFDDTGLGPVPSGWKGQCEEAKNFRASCNRKLVGARFFARGYEANFGPVDESKESRSPRDDDGHGTHTATTAAGAAVPNASLFGYATGIARGMAPRARVAAYKVCWTGGCFSSDILAAMEAAITDGVYVLSLSLGGSNAEYYRDAVAVGAFSAMQRGIFVSCSAGNAGPAAYTLSNTAPWITTVGAGTLDRDFPAYVRLGNGKNFSGASLYSGDGKALPGDPSMLPLIYAGNATNVTSGNLCMVGTLLPEKVKGKIVLCDRGINPRVQKGFAVRDAGGVGMILANTAANREELVADAHLLPATGVGQRTGEAIRSYIFSDPDPTATIVFEGTKLGVQPSPIVSAFSSRGPNAIAPQVLKPDLIAPGVNILAGWSGSVGPTGLPADARRVPFNIISGTSMSCPHVSGLAALVKGLRPGWSPAAVRSALMTTAYTVYRDGQMLQDVATGKPSTPFDHGSGHVDPRKALDPGLIYDISASDYLNFLCALNYSKPQISALSKTNFSCDDGDGNGSYAVGNLNYPSFAVPFRRDGDGAMTMKYRRVVTNVGAPGKYRVSVSMPSESVKVVVEPEELSFSEENEKKMYGVSFSSVGGVVPGTMTFGRLEWSDGKHVVGSPIAVSWT